MTNELGQPPQDAMAGEAIHQKWVSAYRTADGQAFYERPFDRMVELLAEADGLHLTVRHRLPGQFSELDVHPRWAPLKRLVHWLDDLWFDHVRKPGPAFGNTFVFEKRP